MVLGLANISLLLGPGVAMPVVLITLAPIVFWIAAGRILDAGISRWWTPVYVIALILVAIGVPSYTATGVKGAALCAVAVNLPLMIMPSGHQEARESGGGNP
jgi:uncharacterized membrane protein YhaH (DUF805 family)